MESAHGHMHARIPDVVEDSPKQVFSLSEPSYPHTWVSCGPLQPDVVDERPN